MTLLSLSVMNCLENGKQYFSLYQAEIVDLVVRQLTGVSNTLYKRHHKNTRIKLSLLTITKQSQFRGNN